MRLLTQGDWRRFTVRHVAFAIVAVVGQAMVSATHAGSLTIIPTFDPSIASVTGAEAAINAAISALETNVGSPNNITVSIYFTNTTSGLGESISTEYEGPYFDYYNAFAAVATSPIQLSALASLGVAPTSESSGNPVNGNADMIITGAEGRNLGFNTPGLILPDSDINTAVANLNNGNYGTFDTEIALNTSYTSPPNSLSGHYDLQSVAAHEIDEALGIGGTGSTLTGGGSLTGPVGDLDLYRYDAAGSRSYSNIDPNQPYLSYNGGTTVVSYFNQAAPGDFGDWQSNPDHAGFGPQVQDAVGSPGNIVALGPNELTAFNMIGYQLTATPEPSTLVLLGMGGLLFSGCDFWRRKRLAGKAAA